ncbi:CDP-diacylglycerol--glycerol-3-phosphate 3-phosphatidyltransferase [Carbonactinospora thermoautotrophica]|uniref:CDP-diacylglycerol--glycerol-3-phosphate 3-phosphatidyltransferase n=1 Tax=Carbonactinospora thermoautotrophica TaxID=1469144 RepID=A0A132N6H8_9ACTN|nr:CDP-alcohol phosphatidyltransferase family protein [Carbonactinospora thermoautotrophica]KWX05693.1 CDP-diacylglycerol--glycerol-3-phosphate 3-phosphatidyltransferase [Carbonactinospora thermoautotrophica]KWX08877.1 CDP-diacylglycerol--glycerol-3-phosphate 3-phosphatidyltransferase [Carbonactinospora thermoautotrophica]
MAVGGTGVQTTRVATVPNVLSLLRLLGVPVFLWLILSPRLGGANRDGWALALLVAGGFSDYLDGKIARRFNQVSRVGQILDPAADRLYILSTLVGLTLRDIIPAWLAVGIVARDVLLALLYPLLRAHGYGPLPVHFLGKAATLNLLYAFPLLLLGDGDGRIATLAKIFGWAFVGWGTALYWWAGVLYALQVWQLIKADSVT